MVSEYHWEKLQFIARKSTTSEGDLGHIELTNYYHKEKPLKPNALHNHRAVHVQMQPPHLVLPAIGRKSADQIVFKYLCKTNVHT